ncbi:MAG: ABC transporter substrate-binding protein [Pseudomonadota bacterium]
MRHACLAIGLSLWALAAAALEVEDRRVLQGTGDAVLRILSTADLDVFDPYLTAFQATAPEVTLDYAVVSSAELHRAVRSGAAFDVAISSAMDLQFQLANDGLARRHRSPATDALPPWGRWRHSIFAFAAEPAVVVVDLARFDGLPLPTTRQELIEILRDNPSRFGGAVGTYDIRESGLGYLFATQEARATDAYWRLAEVMGRLAPRLYCCSAEMIDDVADGPLAVAYNVLGSYAADRLARRADGRLRILPMAGFSNVILRTALIPAAAEEPRLAGRFVDMLVTTGLRTEPGAWTLPPLGQVEVQAAAGLGPIRLGPALMVHLDPLNRRSFLEEWENAVEQR